MYIPEFLEGFRRILEHPSPPLALSYDGPGRYARAFRQIDINKNGDLSQSEFVAGLQSIKFPGQRWQWKKLFFTLDDDQDGEIGIGEFSNWEAPECRKKTATTSMLGGARSRDRRRDPRRFRPNEVGASRTVALAVEEA